jgi:hypothetical protein
LNKQQREIENARYTFNYGFSISDELADFINGHFLSNHCIRIEMKGLREWNNAQQIQRRILEHIRMNNLQLPNNRKIKVDYTLKKLFKLKDDEELEWGNLYKNILSHFKII